MPAKICIAFLLFLALFSSANATQLSRTTGEVNFREGPSLSAPVIQILPAGSEVQVLSERRPGWYLVVYRGRPGFVHKNYIKLPEDQTPNRRPPSMHRQLAMPAGILVAGVGIALMASVLAPDLLIAATALGIAIISVGVFDLLFQLGLLYSLFYVSLGAFVLFLFFKRKKKD